MKKKYQQTQAPKPGPKVEAPKPVNTEADKKALFLSLNVITKSVLVHFKAAADRYHIPVSFLVCLSGIETNYGQDTKGKFNYFNLKSKDNAPHTEEGYNWYGNLPAATQHMAKTLAMYPPWSLHANAWRQTHDSIKYATDMAIDWFGRNTEKRERFMHLFNSQNWAMFDK